MSNYFNDVLREIMFKKRYPYGTSETIKDPDDKEVEVPIDPKHQWSNDYRSGRMEASQKEDEMLRGLLGSSRSRRRGEKEGAYSLANFPGFGAIINATEAGHMPQGSGIHSYMYYMANPEEDRLRREEQRKWAIQQRRLLGL